jgi:hypothetical protein
VPVAVGEDCRRRFGLVGDIDSTKRRSQFDGPAVPIPEPFDCALTKLRRIIGQESCTLVDESIERTPRRRP